MNLTPHDKKVFEALFNNELPVVANTHYGTLPSLFSTANNVIVDPEKLPDKHVSLEQVEKFMNKCTEVAKLVEELGNDCNTQKNPSRVGNSSEDIDLYGYKGLPKQDVCDKAYAELLKFQKENPKTEDFAPLLVCVANLQRIELQRDIGRVKSYALANGEFVQSTAIVEGSFIERELGLFKILRRAAQLALPEPVTVDGVNIYTVSKMEATALQSIYGLCSAILSTKAARIAVPEEIQPGDQESEKKKAIRTFYEAEASRCLAIAGGFGNRIALALAEKINPYAKLCGSMVMEGMRCDW